MNKYMILTVLTCLIIICVVISASMIPGDNSAQNREEAPRTEYVSKTDPAMIQDLNNLSSRISNNESSINNLENKVSTLEANQREISDNIYAMNNNTSSSRDSRNPQDLKCTINGYLNADNSLVPPSQVNSSDLINDINSGKKKLNLICSY